MKTATLPSKELLDHLGQPKPVLDMSLPYEAARLGMAFHEAGHAVLALAYGVHVVTSEVIAWTVESGWRLTGNTAFEARGTAPWHFAAQCAAGEIAQVQYLMTYGLWTPDRALACTAEHDREQAIDVLADFGYRLGRDHVPEGGKSWGMVRGMARRKVSHLWWEIRAVALAMDERTVLTGDEVATLVGMANPSMSEGAA
ncbi:MAG TPA: hypothetical protein VFH94_10855 [Streptomyces sp.]|nr:hypothetical protein [Streptomyces sp.]